MNQEDEHFMQLALDMCKTGIDAGQSPFGACLVRDGQVLAASHNHVWLHTDATAHAEIECIRQACHTVGDVHLTGATIYSTTEPCPMCFTAIHWARMERIVFAARVEDARDFGFNELQISNMKMKTLGISNVTITPDFMRDAAVALFKYWQKQSGNAY